MSSKDQQSFAKHFPPEAIRGLSRCVKLLASDMAKTNLLVYASGMAYMTLGSIVPSLAAIFAVVSAFQSITDPQADWFIAFQNFIIRNLAPDTGAQALEYLRQFLANIDPTRIGATGFGFLLVIIIMLLRNIEVALNDIWQVSDTRSLFKRFLYFWSTITLGTLILSIVIAVLAEAKLTNPLGVLPWSGDQETDSVGSQLSTLTTLLSTFVFFSLLYKIGPNCKVTVKAALAGGLAATLMIRLAAWAYAKYTIVSDWNQNIYGALAAVPLFLLWLYIGWVVILLGALLAWRVQHGFSVPREMAVTVGNVQISSKERHRNLQLEALMPLCCIGAVAYHFEKAVGRGPTGFEIARDLDLPPVWIREGVKTASSMGLLVVGQQVDQALGTEQDDPDILDLPLYLTYPADKISLAELGKRFSAESRRWLQGRSPTVTPNLEEGAERLLETLRRAEPSVTLKQVLERL